MKKIRLVLYEIIEKTSGPYRQYGRLFDLGLMTLILLNAAIILHTVPAYQARYADLFLGFELISVTLFSVEYLIRAWVCVEDERYPHPVWGRLRYLISVPALLHLLAILPFFLTAFRVDFSLVRLLRLTLILRVFRLKRYERALHVIRDVFREKREELILATVFVFFMLLVVSSLMYYLEHDLNPDDFGSIPAALWWGVVTMTTLGYGDVIPQTTWGKVLGGFAALSGVALIALPAGILASGFAQAVGRRRGQKKHRCPHCGLEFHEDAGHEV
jgi:voltage-gated potassium channel